MKVLEAWIAIDASQRGVLLKRDDASWWAQAVIEAVNDGDTLYVYADGPPCATSAEALEQLDDQLAAEAGRLLAAQRADIHRRVGLDMPPREPPPPTRGSWDDPRYVPDGKLPAPLPCGCEPPRCTGHPATE